MLSTVTALDARARLRDVDPRSLGFFLNALIALDHSSNPREVTLHGLGKRIHVTETANARVALVSGLSTSIPAVGVRWSNRISM